MKFQWLKLNIYSLLLSFFLIIVGCGVYRFSRVLWIALPLGFFWIIIFIFAISVYSRYSYKVQTLHRLIDKGTKHFDHRLFYPFFDSPCMRSVVYFALVELNRSNEYWQIKKEASQPRPTQVQPYYVFLKFENGTTKFYRQDIQTGEINEID